MRTGRAGIFRKFVGVLYFGRLKDGGVFEGSSFYGPETMECSLCMDHQKCRIPKNRWDLAVKHKLYRNSSKLCWKQTLPVGYFKFRIVCERAMQMFVSSLES